MENKKFTLLSNEECSLINGGNPIARAVGAVTAALVVAPVVLLVWPVASSVAAVAGVAYVNHSNGFNSIIN